MKETLCVRACTRSHTCGVSDGREQTTEVSLFLNSLNVKNMQISSSVVLIYLSF